MFPVITVDGPAAAGKGTLVRRLAQEFNLAALDTGALYRATAARLLDRGGDPSDPVLGHDSAARDSALSLTTDDLTRPDLRTEAVSQVASVLAVRADVRAALLDFQRGFVRQKPADKAGVILDGRDTGTVICPEAPIKFFVTARDSVRAERRYKELLARKEPAIYAHVLEDLQARDRRDSSRTSAPLKAADDAVILDTSDLDSEAVFAWAVQVVCDRTGWTGSPPANSRP